MIIWRISEFATLDGEGGKLFPGRWHSGGEAISYASDHPASCLSEMLVHVDMSFLPTSFQLLKIEVGSIVIDEVQGLFADWKTDATSTRRIGDHWLQANTSALLRVPSSIVPEAFNFLINPAHQDSDKIRIEKVIKFPLDQRLS
jgi:RES domain-containing protein